MRLNLNQESIDVLACPKTNLKLSLLSFEEAQEKAGHDLKARKDLLNAKGIPSSPIGLTEKVLLREDMKAAYPVFDGVPILLAPEVLSTGAEANFDLTHPQYAEAYEEMEFYNNVASEVAKKLENGGAWAILPTEMAATNEERLSFPAPRSRWIDSVHDGAAQWDAYKHLGDVKGKRILQVGGSGTHSIKFAMAGASEAWLITPMIAEALMARGLAESAGVGDSFKCVVGIAEELPFKAGTFDGIFAGGCLHHMETQMALPEISRILKNQGKFSAAEPWLSSLHRIGTKLMGKRECGVYCRPLDENRLSPLKDSFSSFDVVHHGAFSRYPFLALEKIGVGVPKGLPWFVGRLDDMASSIHPSIRNQGSGIAVLGTK